MKNSGSWLFFIALCLLSLVAAVWLRSGTDARPFAVLQSFLNNFSVSDYEHTNEGSAFEREGASAAGEAGVVRSQPGGYSDSRAAAEDHTAGDSQVCGRPATKSRGDTDAQLVYKWVDEGGQTHLSDQQPQGVIASVLNVGMAKQDFSYKIIPDGVEVPIDFPGQLAAGSKRIYDTWHFFLGEERLRQAEISVLLIGGAGRFDAYYANVSPGSKRVNGFYSMARNQAIVNFDSGNIQRTFGTTLHEVSHLITASHLGPTAPWLTEGLAEYFETMQVNDQSGTVYPNPAHIKLLKMSKLPRLRHYLAIDRPEWHGEERQRNYAIAWSLMNFLLQAAPGMYALQEVIQRAESHFCQPFSAASALDKAYPGGLERLERDWRKWLAEDSFQIQQI